MDYWEGSTRPAALSVLLAVTCNYSSRYAGTLVNTNTCSVHMPILAAYAICTDH